VSLTLLLVLLAAQAAAPKAAPPPVAAEANDKPISVCDLLRTADKVKDKDRDKEFTVRGYVGGDRFLGYFLADNADNKQCIGMPRKAKNWPSTVHLQWPGENQINRAVDDAVRQRDREARDKRVMATITGTITLSKQIQIFKDMEGGYFGSAYGSNGQHPVQITVHKVADIELK